MEGTDPLMPQRSALGSKPGRVLSYREGAGALKASRRREGKSEAGRHPRDGKSNEKREGKS
jgi:hypothetical protein